MDKRMWEIWILKVDTWGSGVWRQKVTHWERDMRVIWRSSELLQLDNGCDMKLWEQTYDGDEIQ